jgi:hypothetical protein
MIENPALKIKDRLFNLNVLHALYLEYFLFKCFYIERCTNISVVFSNTEKKQTAQTTCTVSCKLWVTATETVFTLLASVNFSNWLLASEAQACYQGSPFSTCDRQSSRRTLFSQVLHSHCISIIQLGVHILSSMIWQTDNGQIKEAAFLGDIVSS